MLMHAPSFPGVAVNDVLERCGLDRRPDLEGHFFASPIARQATAEGSKVMQNAFGVRFAPQMTFTVPLEGLATVDPRALLADPHSLVPELDTWQANNFIRAQNAAWQALPLLQACAPGCALRKWSGLLTLMAYTIATEASPSPITVNPKNRYALLPRSSLNAVFHECLSDRDKKLWMSLTPEARTKLANILACECGLPDESATVYNLERVHFRDRIPADMIAKHLHACQAALESSNILRRLERVRLTARERALADIQQHIEANTLTPKFVDQHMNLLVTILVRTPDDIRTRACDPAWWLSSPKAGITVTKFIDLVTGDRTAKADQALSFGPSPIGPDPNISTRRRQLKGSADTKDRGRQISGLVMEWRSSPTCTDLDSLQAEYTRVFNQVFVRLAEAGASQNIPDHRDTT
jgi:hypothetical protein